MPGPDWSASIGWAGTLLFDQAEREGWLDTAHTEHMDAHGVQNAPQAYPHLAPNEICDGFEAFYKCFYFPAPKIASICGEMVRNRKMLVRRLREGVEFFGFLRERAKASAEQRKVAA